MDFPMDFGCFGICFIKIYQKTNEEKRHKLNMDKREEGKKHPPSPPPAKKSLG
jgi:hypothetical protein